MHEEPVAERSGGLPDGDGVDPPSGETDSRDLGAGLRGGELARHRNDADRFDAIDAENQIPGQGTLLSVEQASFHSGPIPSALVLKEYGDVDPTYPGIIVHAFRDEVDTKLKVARWNGFASAFAIIAGMSLTTIMGVGGVLGGFICIMADKPAGIALLAAPVVAGAPRIIEAISGRRSADGDSGDEEAEA